ncbi:MAG: tRNA pseudouridine(55) synthase TruB [Anaerosacchariphilus sp.]
MNGVINVYKEAGFTSHDVVAKLRGIVKQKKIGHTGTLDPDAEGVLPVCLGNATKLCGLLTEKEKTYRAVLLLGQTTDTQDTSGRVLTEAPVTATGEQVREAIMSFLGDYDQVPPMYSALKVNGKKLYELAREGKEVERQARRVRILDMEIHEIRLPEVTFTVTCSSGTYIRTLCQDIGEKLGCGGCMKSLLRTKVDRFELADSHKLSELETMMHEGRIGEVLLPVDDVFAACPAVRIRQESDRLIQNGNPFGKEDIAETTGERLPEGTELECNCVRVYNSEGDFRGLYRREQGGRRYKPEKMFLS